MGDQKGKTGQSRGFSLFELTSDSIQHELLEKALELAETTGLGQEEAMEKALASVENLTRDKTCAYALRILQWEAEATALENEEKRINKRRTARLKLIERLENRLVELLPHDQSYEDARVKVSFRDFPKVEVVDVAQIPDTYKETLRTATVDTGRLKKALRAGDAIPGAILKENWKVQIK